VVTKNSTGIPTALIRRLPPVANCATTLGKCLWALKAAKMSSRSLTFLTGQEISDLLLRVDVSVPPLSVHRALARAGNAVARRRDAGDTSFRVMSHGEEMLVAETEHEGNSHFAFLDRRRGRTGDSS
jgi:hypothetical protein